MAADGTQSSTSSGLSEGEVKSSLDARLEVPGIEGFQVIGVKLSEGLSERTVAQVEIGAHEDVDWNTALLQACSLFVDQLEQGTGRTLSSRRWTLRLGEAAFIEHKDNAFRYTLTLSDSLWPLGLGLDTRKFRNMSARDIVQKILDEAKIPCAWALSSELPVRKYTAQYRESKLAFVERLLEFEGVFYSFADDGTVLFGDSSLSAERLRGGDEYELIEAASGMARNDVGLHQLRRGGRVTTGKVTLGDYNFKTPEITLCSSAEGETDRIYEQYVYPAGYREPEQGLRLARLRVDAHRATASFLEGKGNEPAFQAGLAFAIGGAAAAPFAGEYLLTHVEHAARTGAFTAGKGDGEASRYENRFRAMPMDRPFRPLPKTRRPTVDGTHTAMVRGPAGEEIHTDHYGRFRAQLHWDREAVGSDDDSRWIRYLQETTSSMALARVGWEVMVGYIDGDPDRPIGLGRAINGQMTPTYGQPANKTMMSIKTPSSPANGGFNEIKMDDAAGSQHISVQAEKDYDALIKNDKSETVGLNETHSVTNDFKRHIQGNQKITIGANDTASYEVSSELKVKGNRTVSVGVNESVDIGGGQNQTVTNSDSEKVGAVRINVVGSLKSPDFKARAKSALQGLNPVAGLMGALKNPFEKLLPALENKAKQIENTILGKIKAIPDAIKALPEKALKTIEGLPDKLKDDVLKALKKEGESVLNNAYEAAKKAFKEKGLKGSLATGFDTLTSGAEKSIQGLPKTVEDTVKTTIKGTIDGIKGEFTALKKQVTELPTALRDYVTGLPKELQGEAASYVKSILPNFGQEVPEKFTGLGGVLPSVDQLKSMYSLEAIKKGMTGKLEGALDTATGGLFSSFFPKGDNDQRKFTVGWAQVDKLIDMFTTGGISKSAVNSIKVMVGGVTVKAALNKMTWGSGIAWLETIGGVKYTRTPVAIDQDVRGKMNLTVLGMVKRNAGKEIIFRSEGTSKIDVTGKSTWDVTETIEVSGKTKVLIEAVTELLLDGGGTTITMAPSSLKMKGANFGIPEAPGGVTLKGNMLKLSKS
ncbi:MAG: type VI secretion system tip protein VgrG [Myxococcales bacterium]|nr:type VI secretion system tip protein VgrG [Myxococcales bacterium]